MERLKNNKLTYISLFSGAGIGCYGFKLEGYECIATVEILEKRLRIQQFNNKCKFESGYISDDITNTNTKLKIIQELSKWNINEKNTLDVIIATPPCQGMSVANHKKGNELNRNSLVVESINLIKDIEPKFFIFENVRIFLNTLCTDLDGNDKKIKDAIEVNLAGYYHISYQVLNFKEYGCPSSRTRTLVIGTRKDLREITPLDVFPERQKEKTLKEIIGHLPSLKNMGDIWEEDIYHNFKKYNPIMLEWIRDIKEGESAFDNRDFKKTPHKIVNGLIVKNVNKNGDKYKRQGWNKIAPCIHTRNDILSSQNTIHPEDNRVFSIREVMLMMAVPESFNWSDKPISELNSMKLVDKMKYLSKDEMNIRHSIGEAVPTIIFQQIACKIKNYLHNYRFNEQNIKSIIEQYKISDACQLNDFIRKNNHSYTYPTLSKIAELANTYRNNNAAYYTRQDICYSIIKDLPDAEYFTTLKILEPSIGVGNFLPLLFEKYKTVREVIIDVVDIDHNSIKTLKLLLNTIVVPTNIKINFINDDFLDHKFQYKYDIVIGNPPFKKIINDKVLLAKYKANITNTDTNNIFSYFIEKSLILGTCVSLIVPKSLINAPEFNKTRELLNKYCFKKIIDYGENGFKGVKIETISFILYTNKKPENNIIEVESYIMDGISMKHQDYIFSRDFPYWLIYRNNYFDNISKKLKLDIFNVFRDRQITKKITKNKGKIRVLKSQNICSNRIIDIDGYDTFMDDFKNLAVAKYYNNQSAVLVPNLTYNPRACFLPKNAITDGSVAILTLKNGSRAITKKDLEYYNTEEFTKFYTVARNYGTRSLNIDKNSVFFFGILK